MNLSWTNVKYLPYLNAPDSVKEAVAQLGSLVQPVTTSTEILFGKTRVVYYLKKRWFPGFLVSVTVKRAKVLPALGAIRKNKKTTPFPVSAVWLVKESQLEEEEKNEETQPVFPKHELVVYRPKLTYSTYTTCSISQINQKPIFQKPIGQKPAKRVKIQDFKHRFSPFQQYMIKEMIGNLDKIPNVEKYAHWFYKQYVMPSKGKTNCEYKIPEFNTMEEVDDFLLMIRRDYPKEYKSFENL